MSLNIRVESELRDGLITDEHAGSDMMYFYHDLIVGRLIMARSLGNSGALLYMIDGLENISAELTPKEAQRMAVKENLHSKLLPWFSKTFQVHLDSGEPVSFTVQHLPRVELNKALINNSYD